MVQDWQKKIAELPFIIWRTLVVAFPSVMAFVLFRLRFLKSSENRECEREDLRHANQVFNSCMFSRSGPSLNRDVSESIRHWSLLSSFGVVLFVF